MALATFTNYEVRSIAFAKNRGLELSLYDYTRKTYCHILFDHQIRFCKFVMLRLESL